MHDVHKGHSHHGAGHGSPENLSETERLKKMIEHWIGHGDEHARSYSDWAARARRAGRDGVGGILEALAEETRSQKQKMEQALELLAGQGPEH